MIPRDLSLLNMVGQSGRAGYGVGATDSLCHQWFVYTYRSVYSSLGSFPAFKATLNNLPTPNLLGGAQSDTADHQIAAVRCCARSAQEFLLTRAESLDRLCLQAIV